MAIKRPDTPLAATPEPQPVTSGLQPMAQAPAQPISKYQKTADAAIQQINTMAQRTTSAAADTSNQQPNQ